MAAGTDKWEYVEKQLCRHQGSEEGGQGSDTGTRAQIPPQPMEKTMMRQTIPLEPMEVHVEQVSTLQATRDPFLEQVDVLKKAAVHDKPTLKQAPGR